MLMLIINCLVVDGLGNNGCGARGMSFVVIGCRHRPCSFTSAHGKGGTHRSTAHARAEGAAGGGGARASVSTRVSGAARAPSAAINSTKLRKVQSWQTLDLPSAASSTRVSPTVTSSLRTLLSLSPLTR